MPIPYWPYAPMVDDVAETKMRKKDEAIHVATAVIQEVLIAVEDATGANLEASCPQEGINSYSPKEGSIARAI